MDTTEAHKKPPADRWVPVIPADAQLKLPVQVEEHGVVRDLSVTVHVTVEHALEFVQALDDVLTHIDAITTQ